MCKTSVFIDMTVFLSIQLYQINACFALFRGTLVVAARAEIQDAAIL
jgi:hypothetical protein